MIVGSGGGAPSLCLSPGGGEIGMGSLSLSGGEIGMGRSSVGGGEIGGRFETCPYRCWVGWGEIGVGWFSLSGGEIGDVGLGRGVSLAHRGLSFEVFEFPAEVGKGRLVVVGCGWLGVVVAVVVSRGAAATGGAVLFGHLGAKEHGQQHWRGFGLPDVLEEHHFDLVGELEKGYFHSPVEAEDVVGLPPLGGVDGDTRHPGGLADGMGQGVLVEVDGLISPDVAVLRGEFLEADAEDAFELDGVEGGGDSEGFEEFGWHRGFWLVGAGFWMESRT